MTLQPRACRARSASDRLSRLALMIDSFSLSRASAERLSAARQQLIDQQAPGSARRADNKNRHVLLPTWPMAAQDRPSDGDRSLSAAWKV